MVFNSSSRKTKRLLLNDNENEYGRKDNCIIEFINMIYFIEDRLPYLTLMGIFNKQNMVTQNIQMNPEQLQMLSLNLMSVPQLLQKVEFTPDLDRLSKELSNVIISFTIRQRQFKDHSNTTLPTVSFGQFTKQPVFGMQTKFLFTLEFTFNHNHVFSYSPQQNRRHNKNNPLLLRHTKNDDDHNHNHNHNDHNDDDEAKCPHERQESNELETYNVSIEANSLETFYNSIKSEWISMCRMYNLIKEINKAFKLKETELNKVMRIKSMSLKKIVVKYGRNFSYTIQFQWSKEAKAYDILLGVENSSGQTINYHNLFLNEIKIYFWQNQSIINLVQLLNYTCVSTFALAKLNNLPKFYSKVPINQSIQSYGGFMLIICSLTHFRLIYYSKYCLDVHIKPNGLVSIRDGSFGLTDINAAIDELCPIQFLSVSLFYHRIKINKIHSYIYIYL